MILGTHLILCAYGFWLPNDPRGSWSDFVGAWELLKFGPATKTDARRSVAARDHDHALRRAAKQALKYPPVLFTGVQARAIGVAFADYARRKRLNIWACSILPDHIHLVIGRHRFDAESVANQLKGVATRALNDAGIHPLAAHSTSSGRHPKAFARNQWAVFLDTPADVQRAIRYVELNPEKESKPRQKWTCVTPYPGA